MNVLVINCGSSSLKYQLIEMTDEEVLAKGLVERIGLEGSVLTHRPKDMDKIIIEKDMKDHKEAVKLVLEALVDKNHGVIKSMDEITAVGHRVVHGGEKYSGSVLIDDVVMNVLKECSAIAPLHNPPNIIGINACRDLMPDVPMAAVFDTAFHQTMPDYSYMYALPYEYYEKFSIRKYGFHGTSHKYVSIKAAEMLNKPYNELKIITCHLGNGSSVAAVKNGKSVDTSMGFTPLEGLMMGTRSGDLDPAIIDYLASREGMTISEINNVLNKKSGFLGVSGVSSDSRDIENAAKEGNKRAQMAFSMFCYRVKKYIGAYAAAMGGVDTIVFTAGIGENSIPTREKICEDMEFLGITIDKEKNKIRGKKEDISAAGAKVRVLIIPTDEEMMIARETREIAACK
ncbi:acetate kinase [Oxobacter pfennigii]|uniref:Acetate kinase n=1 Tax=Oxobacter pfennigii TaxID=36849 RepID=A0A0P8W7B4_9CLOT|nr:acetate kinase [Oxobacter pfennigii]KPU43953.1 acetate kinase [Oxobacter pfennigii]